MVHPISMSTSKILDRYISKLTKSKDEHVRVSPTTKRITSLNFRIILKILAFILNRELKFRWTCFKKNYLAKSRSCLPVHMGTSYREREYIQQPAIK